MMLKWLFRKKTSEKDIKDKVLEINLLKNKFKKLGKNFKITEIHIINGPEYISIGNNFSVRDRFWLDAISCYGDQEFNPKIIFGNNVDIGHNVHIGAIDYIEIRDNALIASNVYISDHSHGNISKEENNIAPIERKLFTKGPVIIGKNVWIGEYVSILPNVTIGDNCIIGTGSIVTKSFPNNCVIAGNPARIIKLLE